MTYSAQSKGTEDCRRPTMEEARKGRWAIGAFFLLNGFVTGSWAVQIPQPLPRFGIRSLRISSVIAASGFVIGTLAPTLWLAICAFAFSGIGIANIMPIVFSAAGSQAGIASSTGMSLVTSMSYSGTMISSVPIGTVAARIGFSNVFLALAAMLMMVLVLAPLIRSKNSKQSDGLSRLYMC